VSLVQSSPLLAAESFVEGDEAKFRIYLPAGVGGARGSTSFGILCFTNVCSSSLPCASVGIKPTTAFGTCFALLPREKSGAAGDPLPQYTSSATAFGRQ